VVNRQTTNLIGGMKVYINNHKQLKSKLLTRLVVALGIGGALLVALPTLSAILVTNAKADVVPVSCADSHDVVSCVNLVVDQPDLDLQITPTAAGTAVATSHSVNVKTNAPGYKLSISGDSDMTYLNPTITPTQLSATNGTIPTPSALATNSWGFAIPGVTGFDASYNSTPTTSSKWAAIPSSETIVKTTNTANDTTGDNTNVFYGVKVDTNQAAGNYSASVTYSAVPNFFPAPTILSVSPNSGASTGGYDITITGTNYYDTTTVTIGNTACTSLTVNSSTSITCTVPAGTNGAKDVTVTTAHGVRTLTGGFTYQNPVPVVTSITNTDGTATGHYLGGETVTISGQYLTGATVVKVGGNNCRSLTVNSDTEITCVTAGVTNTDSATTATTILSDSFMTSAESSGRRVLVTNPNGTSATNALWTYRYPNASFTGQGTYLHILGTDITKGSITTVGGSNLKSQQIVDGTHLTGVSPSLSTGTGKAVSISNTITSQGNMQNWSGCSAIGTPAYTTTDWTPYTRVLTDTRDGKQYRIRKLPDGKCWMIDNLMLGGTGSNITLTAANTNIGTNPGGQTSFVLPGNSIYNAATKLANGRCDASGLTNTSGSYLTCKGASPTAPATTTSKTDQPDDDLRFAGYVDPANTANTSMYQNCRPGAPFVATDSLTGCGYLYNWYTATAGIGNYTWPADTTANANATTSDICPAGWHLPKAGAGDTAGNEFATLNGAMLNGGSAVTTSSAATRANWRSGGPFSGVYSGHWDSGFNGQGYRGDYWSSSASSLASARYLYFNYNYVYPGNSSLNKYYGFAVRCVM
jgi:uncharacterized protein (TIGR02145 family)